MTTIIWVIIAVLVPFIVAPISIKIRKSIINDFLNENKKELITFLIEHYDYSEGEDGSLYGMDNDLVNPKDIIKISSIKENKEMLREFKKYIKDKEIR